MAKLPFMPFFPSDYLRDTRCLSLAARGVWMDLLCTLWHAPKRGQRTLTIAGWAGEVGKSIEEVQPLLDELMTMEIGEISIEKDGKITVISRRMVRDERARKEARKRKQKQRDDDVSRTLSRDGHSDVTGIYQKSEVIDHKSESEEESEEEKKEKKEKSGGQVKTLPAVPKSAATWESYAGAYRRRYGVEPVRNSKTNAHLCQLVDRLGAEEAPPVAAFFLAHNKPLYVSARHPTNLLVQDAEGLRTQWATGVKATTLEAKSAEQRDSVRGQYERVMASLVQKEAANGHS